MTHSQRLLVTAAVCLAMPAIFVCPFPLFMSNAEVLQWLAEGTAVP